jgi:sugar/nucleoside kinase (ribokinase family)
MITAIVQPIVDIIVLCSHDFVRSLGFIPGSYDTVSANEQRELLEISRAFPRTLAVGGSATNSVTTAQHLGIPCRILGLAGTDDLGRLLSRYLRDKGIDYPLKLVKGAPTASCISLVTPDGERTMRTHLGVATNLAARDITAERIKGTSWLLLEGYLLTASRENSEALYHGTLIARKCGTKVCLTSSATFVVEKKREEIINSLLGQCDLLFANLAEAKLLTASKSPDEALSKLKALLPAVTITQGANGACGIYHQIQWRIPSHPPAGPVIDTTGAGDTFAGAYLASLIMGLSPEKSALVAAQLAAVVVATVGAQLPPGIAPPWT